MSGPPADELLTRAREGDAEAAGTLLQKYQPYLRLMAQRQLDSAVNARLDPSDVVQQTCLEAFRDLTGFRGQSVGELLAWLRRILHNNVAQTVQRHVLAHEYGAIKHERIWAVATIHIPELIEKLEPLIPSTPWQEEP